MVDDVTATQFHARGDLADWRVLRGGIEANFSARSFARAAGFVGQIATAAEAADHHPEVDLRHPDRVHVRLTSAGEKLTEADVELARTISALAVSSGVAHQPGAAPMIEVAIDALDIEAIRPFWKAVLDYEDDPSSPEGAPVIALVDPLRIGPAVWFQQMDERRPQRNRIHLDVTVPHDLADERVAAAIAAGATLVTDRYARSFWVLADAEGNEACICTWEDRD